MILTLRRLVHRLTRRRATQRTTAVHHIRRVTLATSTTTITAVQVAIAYSGLVVNARQALVRARVAELLVRVELAV